mmetsp:Transcript_64598/g.140282  ORF Transcript_64598/g.140282 Transcript_64598/m.140282 type:complete len:254 (+) Transcript_64598:205-966(+)|eukprot:CAMPEP_0206454586 /NCGR_PEP_ID=MMETSP0324_2-20121206/21223_1 /ASSEMBLY_ACC=CAM_ASM_000836 /TAXON_ID=2866 /ORGANISM="Crypthecodinium cohnii, Strain Seligo" /LENGTH=253 /DNA_ID=CAMNT_0053925083 /DNA_START=128 /DNA_END=889 /DNA_ORIENTATION=+
MTLGQMWHSSGGVEVQAPEVVERPWKRMRRVMMPPPPPMRLGGMDWGASSPLLMMRGISDLSDDSFSFLRGIGSLAEDQWPSKRRPRPRTVDVGNDGFFFAGDTDARTRCQPCSEAGAARPLLESRGPTALPAVPILPAGTFPDASDYRRKRSLPTTAAATAPASAALLRPSSRAHRSEMSMEMEDEFQGEAEEDAMRSMMNVDGLCSCSLRGLSYCMCDAFLHDSRELRESKMMEYCTELDYCGWEACNYDI